MPAEKTLARPGPLGRKVAAHGPLGRKHTVRAGRRVMGCCEYGPVQFFHSYLPVIFPEALLFIFVQDLDKFSTSFPIQNYPRKILFRKQKSKRIVSGKYKVHEFLYSCFSAATREMCSF